MSDYIVCSTAAAWCLLPLALELFFLLKEAHDEGRAE